MAADIEQVFRSFVVSKFREIQQELSSGRSEGQLNGETNPPIEGNQAGDTAASARSLPNEEIVQKIEEVLSGVLDTELRYKPDLKEASRKSRCVSVQTDPTDEVPTKKSKKHKKHKNKKKKKKKEKEKKYKRQPEESESKLKSHHDGNLESDSFLKFDSEPSAAALEHPVRAFGLSEASETALVLEPPVVSMEVQESHVLETLKPATKAAELSVVSTSVISEQSEQPMPGMLEPSMTIEEKVAKKSGGATIEELTEKCKQIAQSKEDDDVIVNKPHVSDEEEEEPPFYHHPFKLSEPKPIFFNLNIAAAKPTPPKSQVTLTKEFPVSSGSQHRKKEADSVYGEWVPVEKNGEESKDDDNVFSSSLPSEPVDISTAMSERALAQKRLSENAFDLMPLASGVPHVDRLRFYINHSDNFTLHHNVFPP